jgi:hypothetical protein
MELAKATMTVGSTFRYELRTMLNVVVLRAAISIVVVVILIVPVLDLVCCVLSAKFVLKPTMYSRFPSRNFVFKNDKKRK